MRPLLTIIFAFSFILATSAQSAFSKFYKANQEKTLFSINLSGSTGGSFFDKEDADDFKKLIKKSSDFKLLVFNNDDQSVSKAFNKFRKRAHLKTLVRVKDNANSAEIFFIEKDDFIREVIVRASNEDKQLVLLALQTKLTKDELSTIMASARNKVASK